MFTMTILDAVTFVNSQLICPGLSASERDVATPPVRGLISATGIARHELGGFADPAVETVVGVGPDVVVDVEALALAVVDVVALAAVLLEVAALPEDPHAARSNGPMTRNANGERRSGAVGDMRPPRRLRRRMNPPLDPTADPTAGTCGVPAESVGRALAGEPARGSLLDDSGLSSYVERSSPALPEVWFHARRARILGR
jgi:hypothetical protein